MMDRREFLLCGGVAGAAFATATPLSAWGRALSSSQRPTSILVDAQGGIGGFDEHPNGPVTPSPRLLHAIREHRIDIISMTMCVVGNGPDRLRSAIETLGFWDQLIRDNHTIVSRIESAADIRAAHASGRIGIIYNFQDTTALEGDPDHVATFNGLGVKVMQLTYNKRNLCGDGCLEEGNAGTSDFGREVIARINKERVLLDLSHAGQRTTAEAIAVSKSPPAITHGGCRSLVDFPRNTYDAEMRALAEKGGVFGVYLMPFLKAKGQPTAEDFVRHLEHAVDVCGEDHVGIGTDNPMFGIEVNEQTRKQQREFYESRAKQGIAAPGEAPDVLNMVEGYNDVLRFEHLADDLAQRGWTSARIGKVLGENFVRLFGDVWGG
jgi:membrane dipeptidase